MLLTVADFKQRVSHSLESLVEDLQETTGRYGEPESQAWRSSLTVLNGMFAGNNFDKLHLYLNSRGHLSLEYQLPSSSSWADVVLLGKLGERSSAVFLELKHWNTTGDQPGPVEGLINHQGRVTLHPSDQVRGYTEYCRRFHSAVHAAKADVHGCVLFTTSGLSDAYQAEPNRGLASQYPCFAIEDSSAHGTFPQYLEARLQKPDEPFATSFEQGVYSQDRNFIAEVGQQLMDSEGPFVLLDGQREALAKVQNAVSVAASTIQPGRKKVVVVRGPPGSGKSVVAAKTWATLAQDASLRKGNIVFTTTSACQNSNWESLFRTVSQRRGAGGAVLKANAYFPITTHELGQIRKRLGRGWLGNINAWRKNLDEVAVHRKGGFRVPSDHFFVSIVDEAHALINPEHTDSRGQFGFVVAAGPQAYHIIRASEVSVFFLDPEQCFRERETTTIDDIKAWSHELGVDVVEEISLEGHQFRCAGSVEYVDWAERLLGNTSVVQVRASKFSPTPAKVFSGVQDSDESRGMDVRIFDSLGDLEAALRLPMQHGMTSRLMASYARQWATKGVERPHQLADAEKDFYEPDTIGRWVKVWNYVPKNNYAPFIQALPGTAMAIDPLCEVGCPYVVRGFDFDYVGILWFSDLVWRDDRWQVQLDHVHESGLSRHKSRAKKERFAEGPEHTALAEKIIQGYRILLTRARQGVFFWFEDGQTRARVQECLVAAKQQTDNLFRGERTVSVCKNCGKGMRLPAGRRGYVICPSCRSRGFYST